MAQFGRKLEFVKNNPTDRLPSQTNQMFMVGISQQLRLSRCGIRTRMTRRMPLGVSIKLPEHDVADE